MQRLHTRVWCQAWYDTFIEVPDGMGKKEAFAYAKENLDKAPLTALQYLPDSDEIDDEDFDSAYLSTEEDDDLRSAVYGIISMYIRYLKNYPDMEDLEDFLGYPATAVVIQHKTEAIDEVLNRMPDEELESLACGWYKGRKNDG